MLLDGKALSKIILNKIKNDVDKLDKKPHLAVILVGDDDASKIYVRNKKKTAESLGIKSTVIELPEDTTEEVVIENIKKLNNDEDVTAILVQMPLPKHINKDNIVTAIDPKKDVDCFTPENVGRLAIGMKPYFYPVTPQGIIIMLDHYNVPIEGKHAVIIGRSNIVGKPMAQMLLQRNATVTICHSKTKNLAEITKEADILVAAIGKPKFVTADMVKEGATVIDVGINRLDDGKLVGDTDFENIKEKVSYITPVPGGVGPMTIAMLMYNVVKAAKQQ